ncbi:MAG: VF530 family protein [Burkholderiaceae bacterium]
MRNPSQSRQNIFTIRMTAQPNNPLHGISLEQLLTKLVAHYGWEELSKKIDIKCFKNDPSIKSSLTFLRKTPWARTKLEELYVASLGVASSIR